MDCCDCCFVLLSRLWVILTSDYELVQTFYSLGDVSSKTQCIYQIQVVFVEYEVAGSHTADIQLNTVVNLVF